MPPGGLALHRELALRPAACPSDIHKLWDASIPQLVSAVRGFHGKFSHSMRGVMSSIFENVLKIFNYSPRH